MASPKMPDLISTLGSLVMSFQAAPQGVSGRIWDELRPWLTRLAVNAAPKWLPRLSFGFSCAVPVYQGGEPVHACPKPAVAACDVCQQPCCLDHARIDQFGDAICYLCVVKAVQREQAERAAAAAAGRPPGQQEAHAGHQQGAPGVKPPPPAQDLAWARKTLGLKKSADWEETRAAHRRLSAKWHPDRHAGAGYAAAEDKFKQVQRAFDLLGKEREQKEAA